MGGKLCTAQANTDSSINGERLKYGDMDSSQKLRSPKKECKFEIGDGEWYPTPSIHSVTYSQPGSFRERMDSISAFSTASALSVASAPEGSQFNNKKLRTFYRLTPTVLGKGAFGVVRVAHRKLDDREYACKVISKKKFGKNPDALQTLRFEMKLVQQISHPNICKCIDLFENKQNYGMIFEIMRGGHLLQRLERLRNNGLKHKQIARTMGVRQVFFQILSALQYLHSQGIVHRDVKPENILFEYDTTAKPNCYRIKLIDFSAATQMTPVQKSVGGRDNTSDGNEIRRGWNKVTETCGTYEYAAPKIFLMQPYDMSVDLWSAGCVLYLLLSGKKPFHFEFGQLAMLMDQVLYPRFDKLIDNNSYWKAHVSKSAIHLVKSLLCVNSEQRITARQALDHPWLKGVESTLSTECFPTKRLITEPTPSLTNPSVTS